MNENMKYILQFKKKKKIDGKDRSILLKENKEKCTLGSAQQA